MHVSDVSVTIYINSSIIPLKFGQHTGDTASVIKVIKYKSGSSLINFLHHFS